MKKYAFLLLIILIISACKREQAVKDQVNATVDLPEDFLDFYQRFLTDSLYQMEHILFPLQGLPDKADSTVLAENNFRWQMDDWVMHRPIDKESGFSVNLQPVTETIIKEQIQHESGLYGMERRYAFMDDGWYLIYYAGLNALNN
ncbi:MAG: hypothetical protein R2824_12985 [Saprospiraceae bacterium]|nr:hypothetical protein [Lewinella sp.]